MFNCELSETIVQVSSLLALFEIDLWGSNKKVDCLLKEKGIAKKAVTKGF